MKDGRIHSQLDHVASRSTLQTKHRMRAHRLARATHAAIVFDSHLDRRTLCSSQHHHNLVGWRTGSGRSFASRYGHRNGRWTSASSGRWCCSARGRRCCCRGRGWAHGCHCRRRTSWRRCFWRRHHRPSWRRELARRASVQEGGNLDEAARRGGVLLDEKKRRDANAAGRARDAIPRIVDPDGSARVQEDRKRR